jgi:hypothetical protein
VSCPRDSLAKPGHAGQDLIGRLGPHERLGILVGHVEVLADGGLQRPGAPMGASLDLFLGEEGEPALHQVQPRRARWREVQVEARALGQPPPDARRLVRAVVVDNQVNGELLGDGRVDRVEELAELDGAMPAMQVADDRPRSWRPPYRDRRRRPQESLRSSSAPDPDP